MVRSQLSVFVILTIKIVSGDDPYSIFHSLPIVLHDVANPICQAHFNLIAAALQNRTLWAYQVWDSSAKSDVGLLEGNTYELGNYDECLQIQNPINTQYCLVKIRIKNIGVLNFTNQISSSGDNPYDSVYKKIFNNDKSKTPRNSVYWGMCFPASCSVEDLQANLQKYISNQTQDDYEVYVHDKSCHISKNHQFTDADYSFCALVIVIVLIVIICTLYDVYYVHDDDRSLKTPKLLMCFSLKQNFKDFCRNERSNSSLYVLHSVRNLVMFCVVMAHGTLINISGPLFNTGYIEKIISLPPDAFIDIFFLMGGLLSTYNFMKQSEKKNESIVKSIVIRYFRLIPLFAFVSFFYATVYDKIGSGPVWDDFVGNEAQYCKENWWTNLLTINNYVNVERSCLLQGWYIPCDFHFFVCSLLINTMIKHNKKIGFAFLSILYCASVLLPFFTVYMGDFDAFSIADNSNFKNFRKHEHIKKMYVPTHMRISSYIVGMVFGHIYYKLKDRAYKISTLYSLVIGFGFCAIALTSIFTEKLVCDPLFPCNKLDNAIYVALHRPIFDISVCICVFVVSFGYIQFLSEISQWSIWSMVAKLTYGIYLTHMILQFARPGNVRISYTVTPVTGILNGLLDFGFAGSISFFTFHLVENSIGKFVKELLHNDDKVMTIQK